MIFTFIKQQENCPERGQPTRHRPPHSKNNGSSFEINKTNVTFDNTQNIEQEDASTPEIEPEKEKEDSTLVINMACHGLAPSNIH